MAFIIWRRLWNMNHYFKETLSILENALKSLNESEFERLLQNCVKTLKSKNRIIVSGLGKNVAICEKFVGTMVSLGLDAGFVHTNSAVHGDMGVIREKDLVILLSKSGETEETLYLEQLLEERKVEIWLLSFEQDSTLARKLQNKIIMELQHEGDAWNIVPNNSTTLNLIVLQELAMRIAQQMEVTLNDFKKNHPGGHIGVQLRNR